MYCTVTVCGVRRLRRGLFLAPERKRDSSCGAVYNHFHLLTFNTHNTFFYSFLGVLPGHYYTICIMKSKAIFENIMYYLGTICYIVAPAEPICPAD